jgi:hypothetical protein
MAVTLQEIEGAPATWPAVPAGLSVAAAALAPAMIWGRIEAYTSTRYTSRSVVWVVEGPGDWAPRLEPVTIATVEGWTGTTWTAVTVNPSPFGGYCFPGEGPYRISGTVGGGTVPALVSEAYRRLAEYLAAADDAPVGATDYSTSIGSGAISESFSRAATWVARAMINSGAADLLRPYRRAA